MLRGLYTAAAGMMTQQNRHDTVTNNIANMNTTGYKQVSATQHSFPDVLISLVGGDASTQGKSLGRLNTGVFTDESLPLFSQGDELQTRNASDLALVSDLQLIDPNTNDSYAFDKSGKFVKPDGEVVYRPQAFFTLRDQNNEIRYTRDGSFIVNDLGELVTKDGSHVLDTDNQPIVLDVPISELAVNGRGEWINATTGQPVSATQLLITRIENPNVLVHAGVSEFKFSSEEDATSNARPVDDTDKIEVRQGYLERSNVDPAQSMVDLMAAMRAYEANQKVIQFYDKSLDKAVNEVGRV